MTDPVDYASTSPYIVTRSEALLVQPIYYDLLFRHGYLSIVPLMLLLPF